MDIGETMDMPCERTFVRMGWIPDDDGVSNTNTPIYGGWLSIKWCRKSWLNTAKVAFLGAKAGFGKLVSPILQI